MHAAVQEIKAREKQQPATAAEGDIHRDHTGYAIPEELLPQWERGEDVIEMQKLIARTERLVKAAYETEGPFWAPVNLQSIAIELHRAKRELETARPYAVCCTCHGREHGSCVVCKGRGFISQNHYEKCVPEEVKAERAKSCVCAE